MKERYAQGTPPISPLPNNNPDNTSSLSPSCDRRLSDTEIKAAVSFASAKLAISIEPLANDERTERMERMSLTRPVSEA